MLIQRKLHVNSHVRIQSTNKSEEVGGPENASMLADGLELLPEDCSAAVSSKDHEVTDWAEGSMKVFV